MKRPPDLSQNMPLKNLFSLSVKFSGPSLENQWWWFSRKPTQVQKEAWCHSEPFQEKKYNFASLVLKNQNWYAVVTAEVGKTIKRKFPLHFKPFSSTFWIFQLYINALHFFFFCYKLHKLNWNFTWFFGVIFLSKKSQTKNIIDTSGCSLPFCNTSRLDFFPSKEMKI